MDANQLDRPARFVRLDVALATLLLGLPLASGAQSFPPYPLQTGATQVPPNILFILDDSGSMGSLRMPVDTYDELGDSPELRASNRNTVYYNPSVEYKPWMQADGSRMTEGTSFTAVFSDYDLAAGTRIDLTDSTSCGSHIQNGSLRQVCGWPRQSTYYVLRSGRSTTSNNNADYFRYQIRRISGDLKVVRSEWTTARPNPSNREVARGCADPSTTNAAWRNCTFELPVPSLRGTEAAEIANFATWFSYHRSRMKMAKAGALEAFSLLGSNIRVGYRTIWNQNNFNIPVQDGNSGRFEDATGSVTTTSRSTWFQRVINAETGGGTPLQGALQGAGEYFSNAAASGPYGPETGANQYQCRQNFSILTTDGYYNNNANFNSAAIGEQDNTPGPSIYDPDDKSTAVRYTPALPFSSPDSNTLGDIAMKYWKTDLRTDLDNEVPTSDSNKAFWQHMVTFGISIGLKGSLDQNSVADLIRDGSPRKNGVAVPWPTPGTNKTTENIDDLLHAALNGRGDFIAASNAQSFGEALNGVLGKIQGRLSSGSNVSTNSTSFQDNTRMYQATYMPGTWSGDVVSRAVTALGGIAETESWRVSSRIAASMSDADTRNDFDDRTVLTWDTSRSRSADFPTAGQEGQLGRSTGAAVVTGEDNANYIKGNQANERSNGGSLRNRAVLLGDIVNSSPSYLRESNSLFVGANDGMLHAIDALDGDVLFSYVPAGINFARLASLSDPNYEHAFFVDGPVAVTSQALAGANYLVGTLGRGGKGAFALDVTDTARPAAIWDHTASPDADMGYVIGTPLLAKSNIGSGQMVAIVGNGIDSASGSAALYVYDLATGAQIAKFVVGTTGGNGLSAPRGADTNGDGRVDSVYAGDLQGNVWKFDLSSSNVSSWNVAFSGSPFFRTQSGQPITGGLAIAQDPTTRKIWITFGTGRLISLSDMTSTTTQSLYGVIDSGNAVSGPSELTQRSIAAYGKDAQDRNVRAFEFYSPLPADSDGWYINLGVPTAGERVVSGPRVRGRAAFYSSVIPDVGGGCTPGGTGYLNVLDLFTGTSPAGTGEGGSTSYFDFNGNGSGNEETVAGGGRNFPVGSVDFGIGMPTESGQIDKVVLVCGSDGKCEDPTTTATGGTPRRVGWREILRDL